VVLALAGYSYQYQSSGYSNGFACFGLYTLATPFSVGILLPITSFYVKINKGNVPHYSYTKTVLNSVLPLALAAIGLPGITHLGSYLKSLASMVLKCGKCCGMCCNICCQCGGGCKINMHLLSLNMFTQLDYAKYLRILNALVPMVWTVVAIIIVFLPAIVFIGNVIISLLNSIALIVCIATITFVSTMLLPKLLMGWREMIKQGVVRLVKELFTLKDQQFDLPQVGLPVVKCK
jgi:hypothetical protein